MSELPWSKAIVVGASSGLGRELARQLVGGGCCVVAVARRAELLTELRQELGDTLHPLVHDVTDFDSVPDAFERAEHELGGVDLVIYCSGLLERTNENEYNTVADLRMLQVNTAGAIAWLNQAAVRFGKSGKGTIVAISSVAGDRGRGARPVYNASKAALTSYLESLRNRLSRRGVIVVTIKPGVLDTEMSKGMGMKGAMPVKLAAKKILKLSQKTGEYYLKLTHRVIFWVIRHLPSSIMRRLHI